MHQNFWIKSLKNLFKFISYFLSSIENWIIALDLSEVHAKIKNNVSTIPSTNPIVNRKPQIYTSDELERILIESSNIFRSATRSHHQTFTFKKNVRARYSKKDLLLRFAHPEHGTFRWVGWVVSMKVEDSPYS